MHTPNREVINNRFEASILVGDGQDPSVCEQGINNTENKNTRYSTAHNFFFFILEVTGKWYFAVNVKM